MPRSLVPALLLLASCVPKPPPTQPPPPCPAWTRLQAHPDYAPPQYLTGVGVMAGVYDPAQAADASRAAAVADLVQSLSVEVRSHLRSDQWVGPGGEGERVAQSLEVTSHLSLGGVRAVERCFDPSRATLYTLVVIERQALSDGLQTRSRSLTEDAEAELSEAEAYRRSGRPLSALGALGRARETCRAFSELRQIVGVIDPPRIPTSAAPCLELEALRIQTLAAASVSVSSGEPALTSLLLAALQGVGLPLGVGGLRLELVTQIESIAHSRSASAYVGKGWVELILREPGGARSWRGEGKGGGRSKEAAVQATVRAATEAAIRGMQAELGPLLSGGSAR